MIRAKNKFYRLLRLDDETKKAIKFYRHVKEAMLKDSEDVKRKKEEK